jgi:hypothetical protein
MESAGFIRLYPLIAEVETAAAISGFEKTMCLLGEVRDRLLSSELNVCHWHMKEGEGVSRLRIGIHALESCSSKLFPLLMTQTIGTEPLFASIEDKRTDNLTSSVNCSILSRLPFNLPELVGSLLLEAFTAASNIVIDLDRQNRGMLTHATQRALVFSHLVERIFAAQAYTSTMRQQYSSFHCDWIIRVLVLMAGKSQEKAHEVLSLLETRAAAFRSLQVKLHDAVEKLLTPSPSLASWIESVGNASSEIDGQSNLYLMPFSSRPSYAVLFQAFHVLAQYLDLQHLEEASVFNAICSQGNDETTEKPRAFQLSSPSLEPELAGINYIPTTPLTGPLAPWMVLVRNSDARGDAFLVEFQKRFGTLYGSCADALMILRQHRNRVDYLTAGDHLLSQVRSTFNGGGQDDPALQLLGRFFYGTEAYYYYLLGDFYTANTLLSTAEDSLRTAIDLEACIAGCAPLNADISLQRARIARSSNDWPEVHRHLQNLSDLETGRQPLHIRSDGCSIDYDYLMQLCAANVRDNNEAKVIEQFLVPQQRIAQLNRWIRSFYVFKGLLMGL